MKDMKAALGNGSKADITHIRKPLMVYGSRACEYGSDKYQRSNFLRPVGNTKDNFLRLRSYLRAAASHIEDTLDAMELHQAMDPDLEDDIGMKEAAYAPDTDVTEGASVGASMLPHVAHAVASLNMAITQAATYGLLPADPVQPWKPSTKSEPIVLNEFTTRMAKEPDTGATYSFVDVCGCGHECAKNVEAKKNGKKPDVRVTIK